MTPDPIVVDIDIYRLQQQFHNDAAGAALHVCERLQLSGIPAILGKDDTLMAQRGTLLHSVGPVYLSWKWIPGDTAADFSKIELPPEQQHLPWGTHA